MTNDHLHSYQAPTHQDAHALAARALSRATRRVTRDDDADRQLASQLDASRDRALSFRGYAEAAE